MKKYPVDTEVTKFGFGSAMSGDYENTRRVGYDMGPEDGGSAVFIPVCEKCGRFVKRDKEIFVNDWEGLKDQPNATCSKCGRTKMLFEGFL